MTTTPTIITHPKNGWSFEVQSVQISDAEIEVPFRLIRTNGKGRHQGKAYRLVRNRVRPECCFLIAEENPLASMDSLDLWFRLGADGALCPA